MGKKRKHASVRQSFLWLAVLVGLSANTLIDTAFNAQVTFPMPPLADLKTIDDNDTGFTGIGSTPTAHAKSYQGDFSYILDAEKKGSKSATWEFTGLTAGTYNIYATWAPFGTNNPAATYVPVAISNGVRTVLPSMVTDQRNTPSDGIFNGAKWKKLGTVTINSAGALSVSVTGTSTFTMLDALAIQKIQPVSSGAGILQSIVVNGSSVTVNFETTFSACPHMLNESKQIAHSANVFCAGKGPVTVPLATFNTLFAVGRSFALCNGNNYTVCTNYTVVQSAGSLSSTNPASSAATSSRVSVTEYYCNNIWQYTPCTSSSSVANDSGTAFGGTDGPMDWPTSLPGGGGIAGGGATTPYCGDGITQSPETCDDANRKIGDGCSPACTTERCGDGIISPSMGEECDTASANCANCKWLYCGDGVTTPGLSEECDDGNLRRGDGCTDFCRREMQALSSSSFPISTSRSSASSVISRSASSVSVPGSSSRSSVPSSTLGTLTITGKVIGTTDTVVRNQKDVLLHRFEARAGMDADVTATSFVFTSENYQTLNAQSYRLYADTNNDGTADSLVSGPVASSNGLVTFTGNKIIRQGQSILFEVRADIPSSPSSTSLSLSFASANAVTAANTQTGTPLSQDRISVIPIASIQYVIRPQGSLYVTAPTPPRARQLLAGTISDELLSLNFRAEHESIQVTNLRFSADSDIPSVELLEVYQTGGTSPLAYATRGACQSGFPAGTFCVWSANGIIVVPKGGTTNLRVRARAKGDELGTVSGENFKISLLKGAPATGVVARGSISTNQLSTNNGDTTDAGEIFIGKSQPGADEEIQSSRQVITLAKIQSIENANPDADGTSIPTGSRPIGQFRFIASPNSNTKNGQNKVNITDLIFTVNLLNVQMSPNGFKVYNRDDENVTSPCYIIGDTGGSTVYVACWDIEKAGVRTQITPGSSSIFTLKGEVLDSNTSLLNWQNSALQVSLDSFNNPTFEGMAYNQSHIRWVDTDASTSQEFWWVEHGDTVIKSTSYTN